MPETPQFGDQSTERVRPTEAMPITSIYRPPTVEDRELQGQRVRNEVFQKLPDMQKEFSKVLTQSEMKTLRINIDLAGHVLESYPPQQPGSVSVSFKRDGRWVNLEHGRTWFLPRDIGAVNVFEGAQARLPRPLPNPETAHIRLPSPLPDPETAHIRLPGSSHDVGGFLGVDYGQGINGMPESIVRECLQNIVSRIKTGNFREHDDDHDLDGIFDHDDVHEDREQKEYQGKINQAAESTLAIIRYLRGGPRGANSLSKLRTQANTALREAHGLPHYQNRTIREGRPTADIEADMQAAMHRIEYGPDYPEGRLDNRDIPATHIADVRIMRLPQLGETFAGRRDMFYTVSLSNRSQQQPPQLRITRSNGAIPAVEPLNVYHRLPQAE